MQNLKPARVSLRTYFEWLESQVNQDSQQFNTAKLQRRLNKNAQQIGRSIVELGDRLSRDFEASAIRQSGAIKDIGSRWAKSDAEAAIKWGCDAKCINSSLERGWTAYFKDSSCFKTCAPPLRASRPYVLAYVHEMTNAYL